MWGWNPRGRHESKKLRQSALVANEAMDVDGASPARQRVAMLLEMALAAGGSVPWMEVGEHTAGKHRWAPRL